MRTKSRFFTLRLLAVLLLALTLRVSVGAAATMPDGRWRLDGPDTAETPRSFRMMTDGFSAAVGTIPAREGLDALRASASGEPSYMALPALYARLREAAGAGAPVYLVDLRQESHGYVNNAYPVSWYKDRNWANRGRTAEQVERDEQGRLAALLGSRVVFTPLGRYDEEHLEALTIDVHSVATERTAAERAGFQYFRIAATDQAAPSDAAIDRFVAFAAALPENAWLHFHCHAGHGRTTTFLVFYDIMKNPGLPLETIVARQYALGGSDVLHPSGEGWRGAEQEKRAGIVRAFCQYAKEAGKDGFRVSWSQWKRGRTAL